MVDIVNKPVHEIGGLSSSEGTGYVSDGSGFDFAIGGLAFLSAASPDTPYVRRTLPQRKEQQDTSTEPGEQSLGYWWTRSQSSFHGGAGQEFLDGLNDDAIRKVMFKSSLGVDVWTQGQVKMLNTCPLEVAATNITGVIPAGTDAVIYSRGADLIRYNLTTNASTTIVTAASNINALTSDGTNYYYSVTAGIYRGPLDNATGPVQAYTSGVDALAFVKARLMAANGDDLYELSTTASAAALPATPHYTSAVGQTFEHFAEAPTGIYVAARIGTKSQIYRIAIDGTPPALRAPIQVAELPDGETITSLYGYLGRYLGIGTNRGLRVGTVDDSGNITYGPYVFDTEDTEGSGFDITGMVGYDRFLYVGVQDLDLSKESGNLGPGLVRVDLSTETASGKYAYATDLQSKVTDTTSTVLGVTTVGGRLVFAVVNATATGGIYAQNREAYEASGHLTTSKIRFSTSENKLMRYLRITADSGDADLSATTIDPNDRSLDALTLDTATDKQAERLTRLAPMEYVSVKVSITNNDTTSTPKFRSFQLKALPAQQRQREFVVPVYIYDRLTNKYNVPLGYDGYALSQLESLEALESQAEPVTFQHLNGKAQDLSTATVIIDSIDFRQITPPKGMSGWGGIAMLTLKSVS